MIQSVSQFYRKNPYRVVCLRSMHWVTISVSQSVLWNKSSIIVYTAMKAKLLASLLLRTAALLIIYTVTGLTDFGFTPLLWLPQGCLEKQNYPQNSNLMVWCAKRPKTKIIGKNSEMTRKTSKNNGFLTISWFWTQF